MNFENSYAVIMAGGIGSRFWPKSRESKPKQYLSLVGDGTLIQNTAARLKGLFSDDRICIISTTMQQQLIHEQLPWMQEEQLFFEPMGRNTAPAIGLSAIHLLNKDPNATMVVLPADHRITQTNKFLKNLETALSVIDKNNKALVTIGISPTYGATGFGYIEAREPHEQQDVLSVERFTEKPNRETAELFSSSGGYYWNSGIFIWRADTILNRIKQFMPKWYAGLMEVQAVLGSKEYGKVVESVYKMLDGQSIDYGIMEHADNVLMVKGDFGWSDLGTWEEVYNISEKDENNNVIIGPALLKDVKNSYIQTGKRAASIIGLEDVIVIDEEDALLICKRDHSQDVRWIVSKLDQNREK
jgi:mannose-1-phosphate guanylyltransferase